MQTPMDDAGSAATSRTTGQVVGQLAAEWWWLWLVMGIVWILLAVIVLQFHTASLTTVGIVVGIVFIVAGLQEFAVAYVSGGWKVALDRDWGLIDTSRHLGRGSTRWAPS